MGREGEWKDGKGKGEHGKKRAGMESGGRASVICP